MRDDAAPELPPLVARSAECRTGDRPVLDTPPTPRDSLSRDGAEQLAQRICSYWTERGYPPPEMRVEPIDGADRAVFSIRSDMLGREAAAMSTTTPTERDCTMTKVVELSSKARLHIHPKPTPDEWFAACSYCSGCDGYVNAIAEFSPFSGSGAHQDHWAICRQHRTRWYLGYNLFTDRGEGDEVWHRNTEALARYRVVEPSQPRRHDAPRR
jgi:hypothetical protein